jgi:hypothetical protein
VDLLSNHPVLSGPLSASGEQLAKLTMNPEIRQSVDSGVEKRREIFQPYF